MASESHVKWSFFKSSTLPGGFIQNSSSISNLNLNLHHPLLTHADFKNRGCVRLGNPDLDFQNLNPDFPIEREIRKRISPPRNPSSGWISIKKSKSGFHGFPFYRSIGKSEKGFAKLFSWTVVFFLLSMRARARPLFLRTVFQILFRISQSNGQNENPNQISQRWNPFSDFAFDCKSEIRILKYKSRFPNRTHPEYAPTKNLKT